MVWYIDITHIRTLCLQYSVMDWTVVLFCISLQYLVPRMTFISSLHKECNILQNKFLFHFVLFSEATFFAIQLNTTMYGYIAISQWWIPLFINWNGSADFFDIHWNINCCALFVMIITVELPFMFVITYNTWRYANKMNYYNYIGLDDYSSICFLCLQIETLSLPK